MPQHKIPSDFKVSGSALAEGLEKLFQERQQLKPMSVWEMEIYKTVKQWTLHGYPDKDLPIPPGLGKHRLSTEELQLSLDKLARFINKSKKLQ